MTSQANANDVEKGSYMIRGYVEFNDVPARWFEAIVGSPGAKPRNHKQLYADEMAVIVGDYSAETTAVVQTQTKGPKAAIKLIRTLNYEGLKRFAKDGTKANSGKGDEILQALRSDECLGPSLTAYLVNATALLATRTKRPEFIFEVRYEFGGNNKKLALNVFKYTSSKKDPVNRMKLSTSALSIDPLGETLVEWERAAIGFVGEVIDKCVKCAVKEAEGAGVVEGSVMDLASRKVFELPASNF